MSTRRPQAEQVLDDDADPALAFFNTREQVPSKPAPEVENFETSEVNDSGTSTAKPEPTPSTPAPRDGHQGDTAESAESKARYTDFEPLSTRLRPDQVLELGLLRRRVAQARRDRSERITDNTLIRLALDLLFVHADDLKGDTEDQLRHSLTHPKRRRRKSPDQA